MKYNIDITVHHIEAYPYVHANQDHDYILKHNSTKQNIIERAIEYFDKNNTLFIIAFRDPIERIISHYNFEWRWGSAGFTYRINYTHKLLQENDSKIDKQNFNQVTIDGWNTPELAKYKFANIPLSQILYRVEEIEMKQGLDGVKQPNSMYLNNYYLWFICCDDKFCSRLFYLPWENNWRLNCLDHAKEVVKNSIDMVLITDWVSDQRTAIFVHKQIKALIGRDIDVLMPTHGNGGNQFNIWPMEGEIYKRNQGLIQMMTDETLNKLTEWNNLDIEFYQYVKKVSYDKIMLSL